MKKFLIITLGLVLLVALSLTGLYFYATNEAVQRKFAENFLAENYADGSKIGSIKADLNSIKIKNIYLIEEDNEYLFSADEINIEYSNPLSLLFNSLSIKDLKLKNAKLNYLEEIIIEEKEKKKKKKKSKFFQTVDLYAENLEGDISISQYDKELIYLNIKARQLHLNKLDLESLKLQATLSRGYLDDEIDLKIQAESSNNMRQALAIATYNSKEILNLKATYPSDYSTLKLIANTSIKEGNLPLSLIENTGLSLELYTQLDFADEFKSIKGDIDASAECKNLNFAQEEINFLSNSQIKLKTSFEHNPQRLKIETLAGEIIQDNESLIILNLETALAINKKNLASNPPLKDFATLYIDRIPYQIIRNYLTDYDISNNKVQAHLSLSLDPQAQSLEIASKNEIYFEAFEVLKSEAILFSDIFLGLNFSAKIDLEKNINAQIDLNLSEQNHGEIAAKIDLEKNAQELKAHINAKGDAIVLLQNAQTHIDNLEHIKNAKIDLNTDILYLDDTLEIDNLKAKVFDKDFELFEAQANEKLIFKNFELQNETLKAKIIAQALPFSPFKAYLNGIDARAISCNIDIEKSKEKINASGSLSLENFSYTRDNTLIISEIDPTLSFALSSSGNIIYTDIERFSLSHNGSEFLYAKGQADINLDNINYIDNAQGDISIYLHQAMKLPQFKEFNNLQNAFNESKIIYDGKVLQVQSKFNDIKLYSENNSIKAINIALKSDLQKAEKSIESYAMIASSYGISELEATSSIKGKDIDTKIDAKKLIINDLIFISQIFKNNDFRDTETPLATNLPKAPQASSNPWKKEKISLEERKARAMAAANPPKPTKKLPDPIPSEEAQANSTQIAKSSTAPKAPPPPKAIWDIGYNFNATLNAKSIDYDTQEIIQNLDANIVATESEIKANAKNFNLTNSKNTNASFHLGFDKNASEYYNLKELKLNLRGINMARILIDSESGAPMMSGFFSFDLDLNSAKDNLSELFENLQGNAIFKNETAGTIYFIQENSQEDNIANLAGSLMRTAGSFLGDNGKELQAGGVAIDMFKAFDYNKITAKISRDNSLNIKLSNIYVDGDKIAIYGLGEILYDENLTIPEQELSLALNTYVKDFQIVELFKTLNLIKAENPEKAIFQGPSFLIYGSLSQTENNLKEVIWDSIKGSAANAIDKASTKLKNKYQ